MFTTSAGPTYPPLLPIVDAAAFHAMGSVDVVTLHLQFWFLLLGAVAALAGCLYRHVPAWLLWPSLLVVLVVPRFGERLLTPQADVLVDVFFVVAALLVALWLEDRQGWRLAAAAVLLAGATLTKREGLLFAAVVVAAGLVASWRARRSAWPRSARVALVVVAAAVPWRLWYRAHDVSGEAPGDLGLGVSADRAVDALRLSLDVLFETSLWSLVPFLLLLALAAGLVWGDRRLGAYFAIVLGAAFLGGAWVTYSYADLPITANEALNPIVRYTGALVVLAAAAMPLLLASAWRTAAGAKARDASRRRPPRRGDHRRPAHRLPARRGRGRRPLPVASTTASRSRAPADEGELDLVFGRRDTPAEAEELLDTRAGRRLRRRGRRRRRLRALEGALRRDRVVRAGARVARGGARRGPRGRARARTARLTAYDSPS